MDESIEKFLTASKFKNWIACNYTTINEINKKELKKKDSSKTEEIRRQRGDEFEEKIYKKLIKKYPKYIKIKKDKDRFKKTKEALKKGYDLIHKAYFEYEGWHGEIDFLIKDKIKKTKNNKWKYEVYDTKLSTIAKPEHIIQICIYSEWIAKQQDNELPTFMYLILGDEAEKKYKLKDYLLYVQKHKESYLNFLKSDILKKNTLSERCNFCAMCDWIDVCEKKWEDEDHLNQIANIRKDQIRKIEKHGIKTLKKFSKLKETEKIKELNPSIFKKHLSQAKLLIKSKESGKPEYKILPLVTERGFNKLPKPAVSGQDLYFDIEGLDKILNPEEIENDKSGLEYLFGIYNYAEKKESFKYFWAHNQTEEKEKFDELLNFFEKHLKKYPDAHIYHFNHYEQTVLTKLSQKYGFNIGRVNALLREGKLVDLHKVVTQGMQVSEKEYSLKNLEKFYDFKRTGEIQKANESTDKYLEWLETEDKNLLEEIKTYNREDCESTYFLHEWLVNRIRTQIPNVTWYVYKEPEKEIKNWEEENLPYIKSINKELKNSKIKDMLTNILGFHKREDDIFWQDIFRRASSKNDEDLIEDAKCIGNMEYIEYEPDPNDSKGHNKIYTYRFEKQDYKVKENKTVLKALESNLKENKIGKVLKIDDTNNNENTIKIRSKEELPKNLSIITDGFVPSIPIINAIRRFVNSAVKGEKKYNATYDILIKNYPKIKNLKEGENIIKDGDFLKESLKAVKDLNNSYIYFQGPPGVGKTYTAAFIIIELLKKGKKIGITAQSHKIIFNLLHKIEELAVNENFSFKGFHKAGSDKDKRFEGGNFIKNAGRVKTGPDKKDWGDEMKLEFSKMNANLFSGTAWCFTGVKNAKLPFSEQKPVCDQKLDYIFIDEAGQLSIADIVAISLSAKNVVIIGDQMQLSSPTSALHPGKSGDSVPDYLLENQDTISPDKGVFIDKTRRLHPKICNFISENFYDSRLKNFDFTEKRKINFSKNEKLLPDTGIVFIDAKHQEICRQKSLEEGKIIKNLYEKIIGTSFTGVGEDGNTKDRLLDIQDILVVAPFNVQVNYLKSILPKKARVGTIDIFQGQEAPVTIISMTSSDAESLPRNVDFYFSRNRLNVAISRSQSLSIVIMNKKILEINCKKIEHIRLVNTFMKLLNYEKKN
ncbi:TM0106 family RecB-like putative nuclease [Candidatus Pelagibacter sp.]|nr:TM0106 family RecB-like putative nuclease [Candidatus Pelagibacter sp.]